MKNQKSFTLIEVLIGIALMLIVFLGIFGAYQLGLKVIGISRNKIIATAIANQEIEKIRNLSYESIGIQGGFPDGILQSNITAIRNNVEFNIERRIDYVVDSTDGIASPEDECPNDYKKVEIKISWSGQSPGELKLSTDFAPKNLSQECAEAGGILSVSVFNAYGEMVDFPLIEVFNPSTGSLVDSYTPSDGKHDFPLAADTYKVVVSKTGYSSERTYGIEEITTPENPHPIVLNGQLTETSFSIDKVSSFSVETLSPWGMDYFSDSFLDSNKISEFSDVVIGESEVKLATADGGYKDSGYLVSTVIEPATLINWQEFSFSDSEPAGTQILYRVFYFDGENWVLIPDADLPDNSAGFGASPVNLSGLDIITYSQLKIKANFSTTDPATSPVLYDWQVSWKSSEATLIANINFHLQGAKIIGKNGAEQPVYKYSQDHTSSSAGRIAISNLEWDSYTFSVNSATGLDLENINPSPQPIGLAPDVSLEVALYLESQNSLLIAVQDIDTTDPIFSAEVKLDGKVQYTNEDGQTYFIPLEIATYNLEISAPGYSDSSSTVSVSGDEIKIINLQQLE